MEKKKISYREVMLLILALTITVMILISFLQGLNYII
jgi:hypothetical protein